MALMYRHGPNKTALIGAGVVLLFGFGCALSLSPEVESGERSANIVYLIISLSLLVAGVLIIVAFARYSFTHLWKSTGARHSDVYTHPANKRKKKGAKKRASSKQP